jgi:hypothetical protein
VAASGCRSVVRYMDKGYHVWVMVTVRDGFLRPDAIDE